MPDQVPELEALRARNDQLMKKLSHANEQLDEAIDRVRSVLVAARLEADKASQPDPAFVMLVENLTKIFNDHKEARARRKK